MKKVIILLNKHGRPSMKKVFSQLDHPNVELYIKSSLFDGYVKRTNKNNLREKTKIRGLNPIDCRDAIVIRWGARYEIIHDNTTIMYNKGDVIKLINNKGECRKFLDENGIAVPKTFLKNEVRDLLNQNYKFTFPLIGRPEHHGQGRHFHVLNNNNDILNSFNKGVSYISEFYPKTKEFGVHVANGKILTIVEKPKPADNKMQWNRFQNEEAFKIVPWGEYKNYIGKLALQAAKVCGLDYGRVDIMSDPENKNLPRAVVCELNTAPTLNSTEYVIERWIKFFNKIINNNDRRLDHWDFEQFEKPSSLSWKNEQLMY